MADSCLQCSAELDAPEGWSDFAGEEESVELCEGCKEDVVIGERGECLGRADGVPCRKGHARPEVNGIT